MSIQTLELKTPAQLYEIAPDLQIIAERLENSVINATNENARLQTLKRKNQNTPGSTSYNFKPRNPEHFRIIEIQNSKGRWEKIPSELKSGREQFERDITSIASTRSPQAIKIEIYSGKKKTTKPEIFPIYLEVAAKEKEEEKNLLGKTQEEDKVTALETKFVELSKANGNPNDVAVLRADFQMQLKEYKHQNEINEIKRIHEREIEKLDREIEKLGDEIEDLEAELAESEQENLGSAELINEKKKPHTAMELFVGILSGVGKKLAIENPQYLSALTNKTPEEIKTMLLEDADANDASKKIVESDGNASFTEAKDEYEGYEPAHAEKIKIAHSFLKRLSKEDFPVIYQILAYCNLPDSSIDKEHADELYQFIETKLNEKN